MIPQHGALARVAYSHDTLFPVKLNPIMCDELLPLLAHLDPSGSVRASERDDDALHAQRLLSATVDEVDWLLDRLLEFEPPRTGASQHRLCVVLEQLAKRQRRAAAEPQPTPVANSTLERIVLLYKHLGSGIEGRHHLLCVLTAARGPAELDRFAELIAIDPPVVSTAVGFVFAPLLQHKDYPAAALFPRLFDGLAHPSVAGVILDLTNFLTREHLLERHPAADRAAQLTNLLAALTQRLKVFQDGPREGGPAADQASKKISESVAVAVSLCDALALMGAESAVATLRQTLELGHRRLRTEAAVALARLGETTGTDALLAMAAEPVARLRTLAYAEELGVLDRIDEQHRTPLARAEAELALWLAQPTQLGAPPTHCRLIDSSTQYWPGYDEPVTCYLFRFTYEHGSAAYSNVGIAGPFTHAFLADVSNLPLEDIYAAFAGWQAEHEDIYEVEADCWSDEQRLAAERLERRLREAGCDATEPISLVFCFGDKALVAAATRGGEAGIAVVDEAQLQWRPRGKGRRPLGPREASFIYLGWKLLHAFNP